MKHAHAERYIPVEATSPRPAGPPDRVYCSVSNTEARLSVTHLIERMHANAIILESSGFGARLDGNIVDAVGLIYDLSPWTADSIETVRRIRIEFPRLSVLLYPPVVRDVDELVSACRGIPGVRVRFQPRVADDLHGLENDVLWVLHSHSLHQMTTLALGAVSTQIPRIVSFVQRFLEMLCRGQRAKVDELARQFRISPRTLERDFAGATFPTPKETADWLTLLYLAYISDRYGVRLSRIARPLHITPNHIYRLKRRLLTDFTWSARTASGDLLSAILTRFATRVKEGRRH